MKIIVCMKQVPNTNEVRLDPVTGTLIRDGVPSIINPDDKAGLEAALQLKDKYGAEVHVVSMGPLQADSALREALAMGADYAYLVTDKAFGGADTWATSSTVAGAIRNLAPFDLVIAGRQAIDGDTAQVGPQIAEHLGLPNLSYAEEIDVDPAAGTVTVKRQFDHCEQVVQAKMPCLVTTLMELNQPRYMTPGGIFAAYREKEVTVWNRPDIQVADGDIGLSGSPTKVVKSFPKALKPAGEKAAFDSAEEAADAIVAHLKEKFVL